MKHVKTFESFSVSEKVTYFAGEFVVTNGKYVNAEFKDDLVGSHGEEVPFEIEEVSIEQENGGKDARVTFQGTLASAADVSIRMESAVEGDIKDLISGYASEAPMFFKMEMASEPILQLAEGSSTAASRAASVRTALRRLMPDVSQDDRLRLCALIMKSKDIEKTVADSGLAEDPKAVADEIKKFII